MELNKVYCMDNLELLKQLDDKSIDLIYSDVLYNTGRKFKDYDDRLGTPQQAIEWYRPRLAEMKRVLIDTGSIYLQCDHNLIHYLKVEMDNIFGIKNFQNEIIWSYNSGGGTKKRFNRKHDNILWYSKSQKYKYNLQLEKRYMRYRYGFKHDNVEVFQDENGFYTLGNRNDVWKIDFLGNLKGERVGYDTQKPKELLDIIINASSDNGDVVADFFCGSGTSLVVAKELGRKYIGCDINPRAIEITNKRLNEVNKEC